MPSNYPVTNHIPNLLSALVVVISAMVRFSSPTFGGGEEASSGATKGQIPCPSFEGSEYSPNASVSP
jgi:hypothetical protein